MTAFCISYDLNSPGKNYNSLYTAIKALGDYRHDLDSTWLVNTSLSANQVYEKLKPSIDKNDRLLIIEIRDYRSGYMPKDTWQWIDENVPSP